MFELFRYCQNESDSLFSAKYDCTPTFFISITHPWLVP